MRINLYTTTFNNESFVDKFIEFYRTRIPEINIIIYDMGSTDKTVEIAKNLNCIVKDYNSFYNHKDLWKNHCWKYLPCDTVVVCNINELIDITPDIFKNCTIIQTKGYNVTDVDKLEASESNRNYEYDKFCIFDKHTIKDMHYEGASCNPEGFIQVGEKKPILYHITKLK